MGAQPQGDGFELLRRVADGRDALARSMGLPRYRGGQIAEWIFEKSVADPDAMTNLPKELRERMPSVLGRLSPPVAEERGEGEARKLLVTLFDGEAVECVAMRRPWGLTACISTQIGCPVRCTFCASGADGLVRNLSGAEIAGQVLAISTRYGLPGHIVIMGMGEPLLNMDGVLDALSLLCDGHAFGMAEKHITLSTVGWAKGIDRLASAGRRIKLAVSVHSAKPELRAKLIPHEPDPLPAVLEAAARYEETAKRRNTYEYVMLRDTNDSPGDARLLAETLGAGAHVNLIGLNPVHGARYEPSTPGATARFEEVLRAQGVNVTARHSVGCGTDAACGQLRARRGPTNG